MIRARRLQFRAYSTTQNLLGDDLGPIQRNEDQHKSFRVRQDGSSLPLPPSLDPVVVSERSRWEQLKEKPNVANFTPFQKKLWENPYAHILASPPRQCRATNSLQPSALQTSLHPRPHPSTKTPWLLPVSLTTPTHHLGPPFRFLSHKFVAAHLGKKKAWKSGLYFRIYEKIGSKATHEIIWREDMPELILGLLRERLLGKLKWWFSKRGQLVGCISPWHEHIESIDHVSSILSLKSLRTHADDLKDAAASIAASSDKWVSYTAKGLPDLFDPHSKPNVTHRAPSWYQEPLLPRLQPRLQYPPLEFKTTVWRGQKVAVYSLVDLLGEEKTKELVEGSMYEGESCLVVRSGRHNVKIEMLLMELQCYTADHEP
ncbi:hypothetical protein P280DRAFT_542799 [Massarina eburnea CBS 473.64]|uniref:Uncharacterized protein n=1 Tax=Massarina eburnea CBS 473.64 TaxID=1395130 RepID=A0A6A6S0Y9_9PLEO|nr:hypothetical protein P280DRAFT_542799 [Massarina eburnea CBS 473.64]